MRRVIVTPAGRKKFLSILLNHLLGNRDQFDEWILWANTKNEKDLAYIRSLSKRYDFITHIDLDVPHAGNFSISSFFKHAKDSDSIYLRLDDDICFIHDNAINKIFEYRIANQNPFLIYGNIVNNGVINHIHQKCGRYYLGGRTNMYDALEYVKTDTSDIAVQTHKIFIEKIKSGTIGDIMFDHKWIFTDYERVSINAICWFGRDFEYVCNLDGLYDYDEEDVLSRMVPKALGRPNEICGNAIFSHFSFNPQLEYIERNYPEIYTFYNEYSLG